MKKILLFIMLLIMPVSVSAKNIIYSMDIDVYLNEDGSAIITEVWDVDGEDGTEWYKVMKNLGNMELSDFRVSMDGTSLLYKTWNVEEGLFDKRGYYGINHISNGMELCFGKYDYDRHRFTLSYKLSNFIINTEDSQLIYYNFIDKLSNVDFRNFSVTISSYYEFPNTLDVWGYGYKGYAYVRNGKIYMSNEEDSKMDKKYVVLLAKFPLRTFNTSNSVKGYTNFEKVYKMAGEGSYEYSEEEKLSWLETIFMIISPLLNLLGVCICGFIVMFFLLMFVHIFNDKYEYIGNKKIKKKDIPMYRDIPCNKDIYYASSLLERNSSFYKKGNLLGAIILKWTRDNKIAFINSQDGAFNRSNSIIDLTMNPTFDNENEEGLFKMMYNASRDGYLKITEFEDWCRYNNKLSNMLGKITFKVSSSFNVDEVIKLYGLKKYLEEFSNMATKEVMDVKLWDEYLMFACLFGIADKVAMQLKNMYPEIIPDLQSMNIDYDTLRFIDSISSISYNFSPSSNGGSSYSSGGGGFSSGGGGGGSFGGGGGGSR